MSPVKANTTYHKFVGSWAFVLHRLTGVILTGYIVLHIYALSALQKGSIAFHTEMAVFTQPIFMVVEWLLFAAVLFHALNGIRIALVDLWSATAIQRGLFWGFGVLTVVLFVGMGLLMLVNHQTLDFQADGSVKVTP